MSRHRNAVWHVIAGSTGAGKTTCAREREARIGGVRFSIDEWMNQLYWMDCPMKNDFPWAIERVRRCEAQIAGVALSFSVMGVSCVLDLGFTQRAQRTEWLERARAAGIAIVLHPLDIIADVRWAGCANETAGRAKRSHLR